MAMSDEGKPMAKREENRQQMEQHIFDCALDLFCEHGYKQTTLGDIANEAEVSTRTLYKYFATKESILRRFCKENITELKVFAGSLPSDMPLKEKVVKVMIHDFKQMFCLFDTSYILHAAHDSDGLLNRFEIKNIFAAESIYAFLFKREQLMQGVEPNEATQTCATVMMGIYRQCNDTYRFAKHETFNEEILRDLFEKHVNLVWPAIQEALVPGSSKK